ncbi:ABC transporter substrate-binding protein [Gluconacetobacter sp. Hr-1-5]|uniref:ABC transporter substrate-binding protein n=1 Tax=Gluconacetobacter sp. Hr-1-5 TaxID=3395370 RepID=UPI003B52F442
MVEQEEDARRIDTSGPARSTAWALAPFLVLLSIATASSAETVLRSRLNSDIASTDPGMKRDENTDAVLLHVVEGLVASREDGSVAPMLATGWTRAPDGRSYRFTLRQGVHFHNGAPLTPAEVVWSLRRYLAPESHWRCKSEFGPHGIARVLAVQATGTDAVTITLDRPAPMFLKVLARSDCGEAGILHPSSVDAQGHWIAPIGTGPFRFSEWRRNQFVDLVRFPTYSSLPGPRDGNGGGKHPLVDRLHFEIIPDGSSATAALMRDSLDILDNLAPNELGELTGRSDIRLSIAPTMDLYALLFQTRDPVLSDPRIRRAIALSLDVGALTRVATHGTATANSSFIPAVSPYSNAAIHTLIQQDLARARALVRDSGYQGAPIELLTNRRYPQAFDSAIIIQAMARAIGLRMEIVTLDWATQLARYAHGDYQAMVFLYSARLDPSLILDSLLGDRTADPRKVWDDPKAISLLEQSMSVDDRDDRQHIFDTLDRQFREDVPAVVLFNTARIAAMRARVAGYQGWAGALQRLWDVDPGRRTDP